MLCCYLEKLLVNGKDTEIPLDLLEIPKAADKSNPKQTNVKLAIIDELEATPQPSTPLLAQFIINRLITRNRQDIIEKLGKDKAQSAISSILDVIRTNQFQMLNNMGAGLFLFASMISHDCDPNACFSPRKKKLHIYASKFVPRGPPRSLLTNPFNADR